MKQDYLSNGLALYSNVSSSMFGQSDVSHTKSNVAVIWYQKELLCGHDRIKVVYKHFNIDYTDFLWCNGAPTYGELTKGSMMKIVDRLVEPPFC